MIMKISIIIPAYNEEARIENTIRAYHQFFSHKQSDGFFTFEVVIVLNGCKDNTLAVVERVTQELQSSFVIINMIEAGKGLAIQKGFADALTRDNDIIGFVDADMATSPDAYYDLVQNLLSQNSSQSLVHIDGTIASRYMPGAIITPERPLYKRWGSRIIYEPYVWLLFGLSYYDYQCGAKIFTRNVIETITPQLTVKQWAFDVELLYLCKKKGFIIREIPTVWHDKTDSKLTIRGGLRMFSALFRVWKRHTL
jgi:glycosyltransferase involved in cell wall biosynthesis